MCDSCMSADVVQAAEAILADGTIVRYKTFPSQLLIDATPYLPAQAHLTQRAWHVINGPQPPVCATCGAPVEWTRSKNKPRYKRHCSPRCRALDPSVEAKRASTSLARHGHAGRLDDTTHRQRATEALVQRHGVEYGLQSEGIRLRAHQAIDVTKRTQSLREVWAQQGAKSWGEYVAQHIKRRKQSTDAS